MSSLSWGCVFIQGECAAIRAICYFTRYCMNLKRARLSGPLGMSLSYFIASCLFYCDFASPSIDRSRLTIAVKTNKKLRTIYIYIIYIPGMYIRGIMLASSHNDDDTSATIGQYSSSIKLIICQQQYKKKEVRLLLIL